MNVRLSLISLLALSTLLPATGSATPRIGLPSDQAGTVAPVRIIGLARGDLWSMLGEPSARLTRNLWIYFDYKSSVAADNARGLDTLVVAFTADRVSGVKLTDHQTIVDQLMRQTGTRIAATN